MKSTLITVVIIKKPLYQIGTELPSNKRLALDNGRCGDCFFISKLLFSVLRTLVFLEGIMNESRGRHTGRLLKDQARAVEREFHPSGLPVNSGQVSSPWTSGTTLKDRSTTPWKTNIIHCAWIVLGILLLIGCLQILWAPSYLDNVVHGGITEALVFTEKSPNNENYRKWQSNDQGADSIPIKAYMQVHAYTAHPIPMYIVIMISLFAVSSL